MNIRGIARILIVIFSVILMGCVTNEFKSTTTAADGISLRGSKVYVYSFLDLRDSDLGETMVNQINMQLTRELSNSGVSMKVLNFKDSEPGRSFATTNTGLSVPVRQTIESNISEEKAQGTDYRLLIFPSKMHLSGAWKFYDIRWELIDARTERPVWSSTSKGKHLTMWKNDEDPEGRAKIIVDGVVSEFKKNGLI